MTDAELRALDAEIAEKVMGWRDVGMKQMWSLVDSANGINIGAEPDGEELRGRPPMEGLYPESSVPHYSTDIASAWEVVEKLTTTTKQWFRYEQSSMTYNAVFEVSGAGALDFEVSAESDSAAEAICRAALKAAAAPEEG